MTKPQLHIRLTPEVAEALEAEAEQLGANKNQVVEAVLREHYGMPGLFSRSATMHQDTTKRKGRQTR